MITVNITKDALELIRKTMDGKRQKFGDAAIPAICWVTSDSIDPDAVPRITLGVYLRGEIDKVLSENPSKIYFDGLETEILNCIPVDVLVNKSSYIIRIERGALKLE